MVTVLIQTNCMPCSYTMKALDKHSIPYQTRPVTELTDEELAYYKDKGHSQAPIVVSTSGQTWSGYRPDLIKALALP